jgi:hypothetical protein
MCEKEKISLIVTEEQKETLLSMFGYYGWDVDGVNDSKVTQVNEATQTDEITEESDGGAGEENENSFIIHQDPNSEECPFCMCKPCITDENNRQLWWETESQQKHIRNQFEERKI